MRGCTCARAHTSGYTFNFFIKLMRVGGPSAPPYPPAGGEYVNFIKKLKVGIWAPVQAYSGGGMRPNIINLTKKLKVGEPQK